MHDADRLAKLEELAAHQQKMLDELSGELARTSQKVEWLEKALKELAQRFMALEDVATPRPEITRPPHY
jgi:SlyX protein